MPGHRDPTVGCRIAHPDLFLRSKSARRRAGNPLFARAGQAIALTEAREGHSADFGALRIGL